MSEILDKMDINELRIYARNLESLQNAQMDLNYVYSRVETHFHELIDSILTKEKFLEGYSNASHEFYNFRNKIIDKYYPKSELVTEIMAPSKEDL